MKWRAFNTGKIIISLLCITLAFAVVFPIMAEESIRTSISSGTGFVVSSEGYILTNEHVVHNATEISVTISDKKYNATVIEADPAKDIALLKIQAQGIPSVKLGNSDKVQLGSKVLTLGYPLVKEYGVSVTINMGHITSRRKAEGTYYFWTDAEINPGNSGGPLINNKGEVIGIVFARPPEEIKAEGVGFAIPINQAISLLKNVSDFYVSQMGTKTKSLGVQEIRKRVGDSVAYVKSESMIPMTSLVPHKAFEEKCEISYPKNPLFLSPVKVKREDLQGWIKSSTSFGSPKFTANFWAYDFPRSNGTSAEEFIQLAHKKEVLRSLRDKGWGSVDSAIVDSQKKNISDLKVYTNVFYTLSQVPSSHATETGTTIEWNYYYNLHGFYYFRIQDLAFIVGLKASEEAKSINILNSSLLHCSLSGGKYRCNSDFCFGADCDNPIFTSTISISQFKDMLRLAFKQGVKSLSNL